MQKGRRKKVRYIQKMPKVVQFSPRGKPGRPDEIDLRIDQFEALKMADYQGYDQAQGAKIMGISRPSFGRILREGRKIVADALVNGKIIRITTGDVQVGVLRETLPFKKDIDSRNFGQIEKAMRNKIIKYSLKKNKEDTANTDIIAKEPRIDLSVEKVA